MQIDGPESQSSLEIVPRHLPLTLRQRSLLDSGVPSKVLLCVKLTEQVSIVTLQKAFEQIQMDIPQLRVSIESAAGAVEQVLSATARTTLQIVDLSDSPDVEAEWKQWFSLQREQNLSPTDGLLSGQLVKLGEHRWHLVLQVSDLIADSTLAMALCRGVMNHQSSQPMANLPNGLVDTDQQFSSSSERMPELRDHNAATTVSTKPGPAELLLYGARCARDPQLSTCVRFEIESDQADVLRRFAQTKDIPARNVWLAIFVSYLYRAGGETSLDICAELPASRADQPGPMALQQIHCVVDAEDSFEQLMRRLVERRDQGAADLHHVHDPDELQAQFDYWQLDEAHDGLTSESFLAMEHLFFPPQRAAPVTLSVLDAGPGEPFVLSLSVSGEGAAIVRSRDIQAHVSRLAAHCLARPLESIDSAPMLVSGEVEALFSGLDTRDDVARRLPTLLERFEHWVAQTPNACAVLDGRRQLSYRDLNDRASCLADGLCGMGAHSGDRILVCLARSEDLVVSMLAAFKAGCTYVPVDPGNPPQRVYTIIENAAPSVIVTDTESAAILPDDFPSMLILDDSNWQELTTQVTSQLQLLDDAENEISNLIYTSGSTGVPKGVAVRGEGLVNQLESMRELLQFRPNDRMLAVTTAAFDASVMELCLPLWCGGSVDMVRDATRRDPVELMQQLSHDGVSMMFATPATWQMLIDQGWQGSRDLKVICGGETLTRELADALLVRAQSVWNIYGPTETTICSTVEQVSAGTDVVPIGSPINNTYLRVLNTMGQPVPRGVTGELFIGGAGVARGYFGQPELTRERFIPDPFAPAEIIYRTGDLVRVGHDFKLFYVGRSDNQVKLRGYRIETGEIEAAFRSHQTVNDAVVVMRGDTLADRYLEAYVVGAAPVQHEPLIAHLRERIPHYMIPRRITQIEKFPLNANGKVDRKALAQDPIAEDVDFSEAPSSDLEVKLELIWRDLFGAELGRNSNFFDIGGNSLLAVRLLSQVAEQFATDIPFSAFYENPTIAGLAAVVEASSDDGWSTGVVRLNSNRTEESPLFCIDGVHLYQPLAKALETVMPVYGAYIADERATAPSSSRFKPADIVAHYYVEAIRAKQPHGPYRLAGFSYGGIIAFEMAQQLIAAGEEVERLVLLDTPLIRSIARTKGSLAYAQHRLRIFVQKLMVPFVGDRSFDLKRLIAADQYNRKQVFDYDGAVLLCRAVDESKVRKEQEHTLGWGPIAPKLVVRDCPGDHRGMVSKEHAKEVGEAIAQFMSVVPAGDIT